MPRIKAANWKGIILYTKETPFTSEEKANWEEHYGTKLKQFRADDVDRYALGIPPKRRKHG
jgi:hypothetical protein